MATVGDWKAALRTDKADDEQRDHIRVVPGQQPYVHNYYTDVQFYARRAADGAVTNIYGQRVLRVTEDFITGLLAGFEDELGDAAGEVMYRCGLEWGRRDMKSYSERAAAEFEVEFDKLSTGMMLESWWWPLAIEGWGTFRYDFRHRKQGLIFVDLYESAVAQSLGDVGKVVCYWYAGLFAAAFTHLVKRDLSCIEVQCYSTGEDHCKFLVSTQKRVNAAAFWRNEGATTKDILAKVREV